MALSSAKYYQHAKMMLKKKDLLGFMMKIGVAIETAREDKELLAEATFLNIEALMQFKQHTKVLEYIPVALEHNQGLKEIRLKEYYATAKGYLGYIEEAIDTYKEVLKVTTNSVDISRACIGLSWAYLTLSKEKLNENRLKEAKRYLDQAMEHYDQLPDQLKQKLHNNISVFYYYKNDFEKAIEAINLSFKYCEEQKYAEFYNNLAEIYLNKEKNCVLSEVQEYTEKAELNATKYNNTLELGNAFYIQAKAELREDQLFTALDTLYLAFNHFKEAEAIAYAFDCMMLIDEIVNKYKTQCRSSLQEKIKKGLKDSPYGKKTKEEE